MKTITFIHDSKFYKENNQVFNNGNLSYEILNRYLQFNNKLIVIGREEKNKLKTKSSGDKIEWCLLKNLASINGLIKNYKEEIKKISKKIEESDIVIIRLPSLLGNLSYRIAKAKRKKIIIEVVGSSLAAIHVDKKCSLNFLKTIIYSGYSHYKTKKILIDAENVIYVTKNYLQNEYPNTKNNIGCSDVVIKEIKSKIKKINYNQIKLGMIGFIGNRNKGLDVALKALEKLPLKYRLEVIGEGCQSIWKKEIKKRKLENRILFLGEKSHEDVLNWLESVDIYLQPSYNEGLPRSIIEAMSKGCAVIGTNVGGIPELVSDELIINKGNENELVEVIRKVEKNIEKYSRDSTKKAANFLEEKLKFKREQFLRKVIGD